MILPRLAARSARSCSPRRAATWRRAATAAAADGRLPVLPGAAVGVVLAAPATRTRRVAATRSRASTRRATTGALVFHAGTRRDDDGAVRTAGGRVLTVVGRGAGPRRPRATRPRRPPTPISCAGMQRRHDIGADLRRAAQPVGSRPMIPRYTLPEMGAIWSDAARFERDAPGRARGRPRPGRARPGPGRRARRDRGARTDRRRADRRDRADDRPRRHRLRQPGRRGGRARRAATSTSA